MSEVVLQKVVNLSQATVPGEPWSFLGPVASMRTLPANIPEMLGVLGQEFTPEQLEAARILVRRHDGNLVASPTLAGDCVQGLFLRREKNALPFDMVNQNGSLTTDNPPYFGCRGDFCTKSWSGQAKLVLATCSDEDLAILRMLSLPCTPGAGLANLDGQQVRGLCCGPHDQQGDAATTGQLASIATGNNQLTLVGWQIAKLVNTAPADLKAVITRLIKAEDAFGIDTSAHVRIWQPKAKEFSRIISAIEFADRNVVRDLIWQSVVHSTCSVQKYHESNATERNTDFGAVRRELLHTIQRGRDIGFHSPELIKKLESLNQSFDRSVVDAIIDDAMASPDSVERSLLLAAAELMGHWHKSSNLVRSTRDETAGLLHGREETLEPEELKDRLQLVNGLVKIHRELIRGK